jgi:aminoglycoside phosphotransferase (APT) family kinase protein
MFEFIEGTRTLHEVRSAADAERLGRAFGEFHDLMADLPPPPLHETIPRFHDTPWRLTRFEQSVAADVCGRAGDVRAEIDFIRAHAGLAPLLVQANVPQRVVHNDAKIGNVLFDESTGDVLCVVDLDTVMPGTILFDFGDMVRSGVCTAAEDETDLARVEVDLSLFEALTRGYLGAAGSLLTATERDHLVTAGKVIVFEQAVRYLTDFLEGDRYYKTSRPGHNLDRCRNQTKLVESLTQHEREPTRIVQHL